MARAAASHYDSHYVHDACPESKTASGTTSKHHSCLARPTSVPTLLTWPLKWCSGRRSSLIYLQRAREAARVRNGVHSGRQGKEVVLEVHVAQHGSKRPKHYWAETHHDDATAAANVLHKRAMRLARYVAMRHKPVGLPCPAYAARMPRTAKVAI